MHFHYNSYSKQEMNVDIFADKKEQGGFYGYQFGGEYTHFQKTAFTYPGAACRSFGSDCRGGIQMGSKAVSSGLAADYGDGRFFDTSVDVLLGYKMKDNRQAATVQHLKKYLHGLGVALESKEESAGKAIGRISEGIAEAEKALKKYPNCFEVVYTCASIYQVFGLEQADQGKLRRAWVCLNMQDFYWIKIRTWQSANQQYMEIWLPYIRKLMRVNRQWNF